MHSWSRSPEQPSRTPEHKLLAMGLGDHVQLKSQCLHSYFKKANLLNCFV